MRGGRWYVGRRGLSTLRAISPPSLKKREGYDHMKGKAIMYAPLEKNPEDTIVYSRITPFGAHSFFDSTTTLPCMFGGCAWQVS